MSHRRNRFARHRDEKSARRSMIDAVDDMSIDVPRR
jgi:hypothetical protein